MGFDNECILNIQSLAGEYFCPVCRTLVYPHEAIQTQCTHLYCKPCLSYVVSSTQACPYDGYLVTEAGSKPLMESNKALAETIGKTTVHCLYHRSGCAWQGPLSDCTTHCSGCAFGNSPVVCNRCGIQIVHRQVQEHAQTCNVNGTNIQPQGSGAAQGVATSGVVSTDQSKVVDQAVAPPSASQTQTSHSAMGPAAAQNLNQSTTSYPLPQAMPASAVPTPEQQYYQQYQQYYQQYSGYDPYQQPYQQYYPYQQQPQQQVQQPPPQPLSQPQPHVQQQMQAPIPQVQPQVQTHPLAQTQGQGQLQPQTHPQAQSQIPANGQPQPLYPQAAVVASSQNQGQASSQPQGHPAGQPVAPGQIPLQSYSQVQPHLVQTHAQPPMQTPQYQQPVPQMQQHPQSTQVQPYPQNQPQPQSYPQQHPHFQPQPQLQPTNLQQPLASHPPYSSQPHQQVQHPPPQQHPMQVQPPSGSLPPQFPPPPPSHMRPSQPPHMLQPQQRPVTHQVQQPMAPPYLQQPQAFPGHTPGQPQGQPHHAGPFANQHLQVRPQVPPQPMQQPSPGFVQPQQGNALPHGMPPQSYVGRPAMLNQGGQTQQYSQSSGPAGVAPPARPPQFGSSQPSVNQSNQQHNEYAPPTGGDQTFERRVEQQEDKSTSAKKSEPVINYSGSNFNEVKPESGRNDEFKHENGQRKDETLAKDSVSELHQAQGVPGDSVSTLRVKQENKDGASEDHSLGGSSSQKKTHDLAVPTTDAAKQGEKSLNFQGSSQTDNGQFSQSQTTPQGQIGEQPSHPAPVTEQGRSRHPAVPYGLPGQQQRPVAPMLQSAPNIEQTMGQSPSHLKPLGHGYLPHGALPGEHFQPPGPNQPLPFHPDGPSGGPNSFANRGYEPQSAGRGRMSRMPQGDPLGPLPSNGPDGPPYLHHHGPMESDMYQNQRPPHFEGRGQDSHLPGNLDRGPYRPPYGAESNSMRMNGPPPPGFDSSSAPGFGDENFRSSDVFPMPPHRHREGSFKQFSGPPHLGREDSPKFGSHLTRPSSGYGMDGPSRFHEKDPHGYGYETGKRLPPYHLNESRGRPFPGSIRNNRQNPDFLGPMHGFGRHHMDRLPPTSPGNPFGGPHNIDVDGRNMERQPFGERFPMGPPGHMHRQEFDGPGKPMNGEPFGPRDLPGRGEPGFGSFHDYGRSGEIHGPGGFSHQPRFGESFGTKSTRPHLDEPVFRNSYSRQGFPSDGGFYVGGPDSFDPLMKRKTFSMGWCRICKVDCESVEGLDMHGQTREHQRMSMDMVLSIKKKNVKRQKTSSDREEASKFRNSEIYARAEKS